MGILDAPAFQLPAARSGDYYYASSPNAVSTNAPGIGILRLAPLIVPRPMTISRLAAEVVTIGDVGSKFRIGVYDDVNYMPTNLVLDAGQIAGDTVGVQELTCSLALRPGVYWLGGVTQAFTTTAPTLRVVSTSWTPPVPLRLGSSVPGANSTVAGLQTAANSVTGALPATFTFNATALNAPRIIYKVA